jgi:serine/threonine protein kinase
MSTTSQTKRCPKCGGPIPAEAPQGLCPRCLFQQASIPTEAGKSESAKSAPPTHEELTAAFPQLEILGLIGQGGMGYVFKARQPKLDRFVALKILSASLAADPAFAERFTGEGRALARLTHPNIVAIHDFGQANGFFYLLMEFVDGVNLRQAMKAGRFTPAQALVIVPRICEALQFAHNEGILHRDIKPENILLDTRGRVKIADFGIAKLMGADKQAPTPSLSQPTGEGGAPAPGQGTRQPVNLTEAGKLLGTPQYMAPEQIEHPQDVDQRADIYSLGVVFYEMLTGELPLGRFAPPSEKSTVDPRLDEVVLRTLEKERERRTQTASEVKTQVETITRGGAPSDTEPVWVEPLPPGAARLRRVKKAVAVGLCLALVFVFGLVSLVRYSGKHEAVRGPASAAPAPAASIEADDTKHDADSGPASAASIGPFTKTLVLTRATNNWVGDSQDVQNVGVWSDTTLDPGEALLALVKGPDGTMEDARALQFVQWQPDRVRTSTSLSWFFGKLYTPGFGESEAETAADQLRESMSEKPLKLTAGQPLEVFAVTNHSGGALAGYVKYVRYVPKPLERWGLFAAEPRAIVHVRRYAAFIHSVDYSVALPPGYSLRAIANIGQASTHFTPGVTNGDYSTHWYRPPVAGGDYRDYPARMETERKAFEEQFQALLDRGPIPVVLGQPCQMFAVTNKGGEVYRGYLELVAPGAGSPSKAPQTGEARTRQPDNAIEITEPARHRRGALDARLLAPPQYATPAGQALARTNPARSGLAAQSARVPDFTGVHPPMLDPATGLPVPVGEPMPPGATSVLLPRLDPATGLPVPVGEPMPPGATSVLPPRLDPFGNPVPPGASNMLTPRLDPFGNPVPPGATSSGPRSN